MMSGVDLEVLPSHDGAKTGAAGNFNAMTAGCSLIALLMFASARHLSADVLIERTTEDDVESLRAAANPQRWQIFFQRPCSDFQLEFSPVRFDDAELFDRLLAVVAGMNVEVAAADY